MKQVTFFLIALAVGIQGLAASASEAGKNKSVLLVAQRLEKNPVFKAALDQAKRHSEAQTCAATGTAELEPMMDPQCEIYSYKIKITCDSGNPDNFTGYIEVEGTLWRDGSAFDSSYMKLNIWFGEPVVLDGH